MTAIADLLSREAAKQLLELLGEDAAIDRLMREPGSLAAPDEPLPLHRVPRQTEEKS